MAAPSKKLRLLSALAVTAFFLRFCAIALPAHFAPDEVMNIYRHWYPGLWKLALSNLTFWSKTIRPLGGIYYYPLFALFGLNPEPFTVVRLAVILLNAFLFFRLATRISGSRAVAFVSIFPLIYHAGTPELAYQGSFIYDLLCGTCYFAALDLYIRTRQTGRFDLAKACLFLALYICALNAKEMAVSLPVLIVAWELLQRKFPAWPALASIAITIVYLAGKNLGPGALSESDLFRPAFTWTRFSESSVHFLGTIFQPATFTMAAVLLLWASLLGAAIYWRDRSLALLWIWVVVTPLPIVFLPGRGGGSLYLITAGWSLTVAMFLGTITRRPVAIGAALALYAGLTAWNDRYIEPSYLRFGADRARIIEQFRSASFRLAPGSKILFLNDPFPADYSTFFIAALSFRDQSLTILLQNQSHLSPAEIARMDYVFDFPGGALTLVSAGTK